MDLLEQLGRHGVQGMKWVCRDSTTGRGLRLYQVDDLGTRLTKELGLWLHDTPRQAVEDYLRRKGRGPEAE